MTSAEEWRQILAELEQIRVELAWINAGLFVLAALLIVSIAWDDYGRSKRPDREG